MAYVATGSRKKNCVLISIKYIYTKRQSIDHSLTKIKILHSSVSYKYNKFKMIIIETRSDAFNNVNI